MASSTTTPAKSADLTPRERAEMILAQVDRLPSLSVVAARLIELTTREDTSVSDIVEILESDASLTAALLKMTRRADIAIRADGISVERAVGLLGFDAVRNLSLTVQLHGTLGDSEADGLAQSRRQGLWKHSLAVACASEMLARKLGWKQKAGEAFVCGLLHDIGKLALDACLPKSYARVWELVEKRRMCICDAEEELLGLDHTVAGKRLLKRWGLPDEVVDCAWLHHQSAESYPSNCADSDLVMLVSLADAVVRQCGFGLSGVRHAQDVGDLSTRLGVDRNALTDLAEKLPARMAPLVEAAGLTEEGGEVLSSDALLRTNRELGQLNAELTSANRSLTLKSRCLAASAAYMRVIESESDEASLLRAASRLLHKLFEAKLVCGCLLDNGSSHVRVASHDDDGTRESSIELPGGLDAGDSGARVSFVPAHAGYSELLDRIDIPRVPSDCFVLTIELGERMRLVVVVYGEERQLKAYVPVDRSGLEVLAGAIRLSLQGAAVRATSDRVAEELLSANRRLRSAQRELLEARSISMVAAMAAGAAHELNNPLAVISGRAQLAMRDAEDSEHKKLLETIVEHSNKAARIVTDLMGFAKPRPPAPSRAPLGDVLRSTCQHWQSCEGGRSVDISFDLGDEHASLYVDRDQFDEILTAVLDNAAEACGGERGIVQINSTSSATDEQVRIVVEDRGVGMSSDVLEHCLDPFFSHRPAGRGRGLGLSRAYRLATINDGALWIESTPKAGTRVTLQFPSGPRTSSGS